MGWLILAAALLALGWGVLRYYRQPAARLERLALQRIADLEPEQVVKIAGTVALLDTTLESPLTATRCVAYTLEMFDTNSEHGGLVGREREGVPFLLNDESGTIRVEPLFFELILRAQSQTTVTLSPKNTSPNLLGYLERAADRGKHQGALSMLRHGWSLKVSEGVLREGTTLVLCGLASQRKDANGVASIFLTCPNDSPMILNEADR